MEQIIAAALRVKDCKSKDGAFNMEEIIITGKRHSNCFELLYLNWEYDKTKVEQGFYTDQSRFLDRYEAMELALSTGRLAAPTKYKELWSEDLW